MVAAQAFSRDPRPLHERPELAAVFGAYDEQPRAASSRRIGISHSYFIRRPTPRANVLGRAEPSGVQRSTPWMDSTSGLAGRASDIDFANRLAGWGTRSCSIHHQVSPNAGLSTAIVSDLRDQIPWTQLMLKSARLTTT